MSLPRILAMPHVIRPPKRGCSEPLLSTEYFHHFIFCPLGYFYLLSHFPLKCFPSTAPGSFCIHKLCLQFLLLTTACSLEQLLTLLHPMRCFSQLRMSVFIKQHHRLPEQDNKPQRYRDPWFPGTMQIIHSWILFLSDKISIRTEIR